MQRWLLPLALFLTACEPDGSLSEGVTVETIQASAPVVEPVAETSDDAVADAAPVDRGVEVFAQHCASCHGTEARGDGPLAASLDPAPVDLTGPRPAHLRGTPGGHRERQSWHRDGGVQGRSVDRRP